MKLWWNSMADADDFFRASWDCDSDGKVFAATVSGTIYENYDASTYDIWRSEPRFTSSADAEECAKEFIVALQKFIDEYPK